MKSFFKKNVGGLVFPSIHSLIHKTKFLLLVSACLMIAQWANATTISSTSGGGDWNATTTWVGGVLPTSTDDVIIVLGATVIVRTPYAFGFGASCNSITINGTLTMGSGSGTPRELDVATFLLINNGGTLNQDGATDHLLKISGDFTNNGTFTPSGNSGTLNITFLGAASQIVSSSSTINFAGLEVSKTAGQSLTFGGSISTLTASSIKLTSGDFVSPSTLTTTGNITLNSGTFTAGSSTTIGGNFLNDGAAFSAGSGTVTFSSSAVGHVVEGSTSTTFNNLTVSNGSSTTINTAPVVNGDLTVNDGGFLTISPNITVNGKTTVGNGLSGTLIISTNASPKLFNGLITINYGATWNNQGNGNFHLAGGLTNFGTILSGTGIYFFETNPQEINGSVNATTADVSVALTNKGTFTVSSSLQGSGSLVQTTNSVLLIGGSVSIATLTASAAGNSVGYYGVSQSVAGINYVNLGFSGDGVKTLTSGTTNISGNLTLTGTVSTTTVTPLTIGGSLNIGDDATFTAAGNDLTIAGQTNVGSGLSGSLIISSTAGSKTFSGMVTISTGATWDNSVGENPHFQNGIQNNGTFTDGAGTNFFEVNNQSVNGTILMNNVNVAAGITLTNNGTLTAPTDLSVNGTLVQAANSTLNIGGTSSIASLDASTNNNTVVYIGASQTVKGFNYHHLGLSGSGTKTLSSGINTIAGNFSLNGNVTAGTANVLSVTGLLYIGDGSTLNVNGFDFTVGGATFIGSGTSGVLNFTSLVGVKTFTGLVTVSTGATWNNATNNSDITLQGGVLNNGTFMPGAGTYTFNTNPQALTGTFNLSKVIIDGVAVTNNNSLTVASSLSGTAGSIKQASAATLIINGTSSLSSIDAVASGNSVTYNSSSPVVIAGSYNDLILNQSSGAATSNGDISVNGILTLSTGNLNIGANNLSLGNAASLSITSPSSARMIIASGGGEVRKTFNSTGSFIFPVGDNTGTVEYSPVTISVTSSTSAGYIGVSVVDGKSSSNASTADYLTRYWNITPSGITGCTAIINATYVAADVSGAEANMKAAQLNGAFNQITNGWKRFSVLNNNLLSATAATLTNGQTSVFTGISSASPTVSITGGGVTVCSGTPVQLGATVSGLSTIAYSWSPASGLSATDIQNPIATLFANNVGNYTLTIYDANGISASDNTTVTSHQPTIAVNNLVICAGASGTLTASGASTYAWSPSTGLSSTTGTIVTANPAVTTVYTITGTDANSCVNSTTATVSVTPLPAKPIIVGTALNTANPLLTSSSASGNQWYKDAAIINGATNSTYKPVADGSYTVIVTASNCTSPTSDAFNFILTAVEMTAGNGGLHLFPIPVDKQLNVQWNGFSPDSPVEIRIYDLLGRTVLNQTMMTNQGSLELNHLTSGQFIFQASQGNLLSTQRFMKK